MASVVLPLPQLESDHSMFSSLFFRRSGTNISKARLDAAEKIIDGRPLRLNVFLSAVDQILLTIKDPGGSDEIRSRADSSLQKAMLRLKPVFRHNLIHCSIPVDLDAVDDAILESLKDDAIGSVLVLLKEIADRMIRAGFAKELLELYIHVRCEVLNKYWMILGVQDLCVPEQEGISREKIQKWIRAVKITFRVLLSVEKFIVDYIFCGFDDWIRETCFNKIAITSLTPLIKFGEAAAGKLSSPQNLFMILEMYAAWETAIPEEMFAAEQTSAEVVNGVLSRLGAFAKGALLDSLDSETNEILRGGPPTLNGDIHPANQALMSYLLSVAKFRNHLDSIFRNDVVEDQATGSLLQGMTPLSKRLFMPISLLVSSMEEKSKGYGNIALQNIFLMNNLLYIAQKVTDSELENLFGHHLVRNWHAQICQYITNYLRATWSKPLFCLKDEGIGSGIASNPAQLKKRLKIFNACFEEIYGTQKAWKVPDPQLRAELQTAILQKLLPAYRYFIGRRRNREQLEKHIKYTPEDLESSVYDLFEGSPHLLHKIIRGRM